MVTVQEAKQRVAAHTKLLPVQVRDLSAASGFVLAEDIAAPISLPTFRQSSMDGYAILHTDVVEKGIVLSIRGESRAGQAQVPALHPGQACRIFTGAPVPEGATAVIMQEHTSAVNGKVTLQEFPVPDGKNIRRVGQQIREGEVALKAGTRLSPGAIGFLRGLNVQQVTVYRKPRVAMLLTGDELLQPGELLVPGKIYESNSGMVVAALAREGVTEVALSYTQDDSRSTIEALEKLTKDFDLVLINGGISVGDYDYVGQALGEIGAETIFYKVKQKPGKPLLFARKDTTLYFALPGNPASTLVCFYEYVLPAVRMMSGFPDPFVRKIRMPVKNPYSFDGDRDEFLKAYVEGEYVIPLEGQESFALRSFAAANALIYLPAEQNTVQAGELVEVHLLPD
ncbi:molybdopterin molybdotransferase MoeA [Dyadobacter sandarakinus]|uniref:Molybdopterin molybdenumtransferase n=1 Tax=Dyadobacter sandarakinus TaxID=2747268 RepID=A0ABX7I7E4_9BACT|nr:gephyrin-like molybdotransferase Glp [Dyadobacter sandarakinus]QRR02021.1 molybdopterin molybdotransferase MoeA [Dyadobacter sandarakinus]